MQHRGGARGFLMYDNDMRAAATQQVCGGVYAYNINNNDYNTIIFTKYYHYYAQYNRKIKK